MVIFEETTEYRLPLYLTSNHLPVNYSCHELLREMEIKAIDILDALCIMSLREVVEYDFFDVDIGDTNI